MIYRKGNLIDVDHGLVVHSCNAQGVMGSGVAKVVKDKYPGAFEQYVKDLETYGLGDISVYTVKNQQLYIISAITQEYYGRTPNTRYVSYDAIDNCFSKIFAFADYFNRQVHIPKIGAGYAQGNWNIIEKIINETSIDYPDVQVICWEL